LYVLFFDFLEIFYSVFVYNILVTRLCHPLVWLPAS